MSHHAKKKTGLDINTFMLTQSKLESTSIFISFSFIVGVFKGVKGWLQLRRTMGYVKEKL